MIKVKIVGYQIRENNGSEFLTVHYLRQFSSNASTYFKSHGGFQACSALAPRGMHETWQAGAVVNVTEYRKKREDGSTCVMLFPEDDSPNNEEPSLDSIR